MTSRERILKTLNHQEPDRIPVDLAGTQVTGISTIAYQNWRNYLGLSEKAAQVCDGIQQICIPHDDIFQMIGADVRGLFPVTNHTPPFQDREAADYWFHVDEWGFAYRRPKIGALWYDLFENPLPQQRLDETDLTSYQVPRGDDPRIIAGLREQAIRFREQGYAVILKSICAGLLEMAIRVRGMENCLADLILEKKLSGKLLDKILRVKLDYWEMALSQLQDVVDVVAEGDDFGTQLSPLISTELFRELIKPRQADLIQVIKKRAPAAKIFFHSCGNVRPLLPDFIEMGIDIINPVHITAQGMEPVQLKKDFGRDMVFWGGGIDTQHTLPHGTPQQVRDQVRRHIDIFAPGGGFVFNTIHNIQADVPPENIVAMYRAVRDFGSYS